MWPRGSEDPVKLERELKLALDEGIGLPDLNGVVEGLTVAATGEADLVAVYYDTSDFRLLRHGVSLRSRTGEPGPVWTLKLPVSTGDGTMVRREVHFGARTTTVPVAARDAVVAFRRSVPLRAVAEVRTHRVASELRLDGDVVAVVADDRVRSSADGRVEEFRELEVELADGADVPDLLKAVRAHLVQAGCRADKRPISKIERAIGESLPVTRTQTIKLTKTSTLAELIVSSVAASVSTLVHRDPGIRLGEDHEDLHQFRVAARRLRSDLRTFGGFLDRQFDEVLRAELKWLGVEAGAVRDLDVLSDRLCAACSGLPASDTVSLASLLQLLDAERSVARAQLLEALRSGRYLSLLDQLAAAALAPRFAENAAEDLSRVAARAVPALVRRRWKRLRAAAQVLTPSSSDEDLHAVRILAKRSRYAADAAVAVCGRDARRFASAVKDIQTVLGDHQDSVVAEAWLRSAVMAAPETALLVGLLMAGERQRRIECRTALPAVWASLDRPTLRAWMS